MYFIYLCRSLLLNVDEINKVLMMLKKEKKEN